MITECRSCHFPGDGRCLKLHWPVDEAVAAIQAQPQSPHLAHRCGCGLWHLHAGADVKDRASEGLRQR
jgi:hypothetical protein